MNIDAVFYGQLVIYTAIIVAFVGYFLARRKTAAPIVTAAVGVLLSVVPPAALIFLGILALKKDKVASDV